VFGAAGNAMPNKRCASAMNCVLDALPCTFHAVAIVASANVTPVPGAPWCPGWIQLD
jgi:hypothetical protein